MKSRTSKNNENYNGGFNPRLKNLIIEIVENQIMENNNLRSGNSQRMPDLYYVRKY